MNGTVSSVLNKYFGINSERGLDIALIPRLTPKISSLLRHIHCSIPYGSKFTFTFRALNSLMKFSLVEMEVSEPK